MNRPHALDRLGRAAWLTPQRARAWSLVLTTISALAVAGYALTLHGGLDPLGKPVGTDFVSFWTAARLALQGHPSSAYDPALHAMAQRALFPHAAPGYFAFFYPPTFLLLCLPLALLPYSASLAAWLLTSFLACYASLRRLLPAGWAMLPIAGFPGVLVNAGHGQNGFATAACFGWSVVLARERPFLAGLPLGLLVIKPHLLVLAPVMLAVAGRWRTIAGAAVSGAALVAVSWLVLGRSAWSGFLQNSALARATLEQGLVQPWKMQSVFAAARLLHAGDGLAFALQALVAAVVCLQAVRIGWRRTGLSGELALLVVATTLCTPFLLDYDLMILAVPIAWVAAQAQRDGWRDWEKLVLLLAYALPLAARPIAMALGLPVAPLVIAGLMLVMIRRLSKPNELA
nr:glycosyltransferase family 87 protein [uncultured Lichenicoccus sp.]